VRSSCAAPQRATIIWPDCSALDWPSNSCSRGHIILADEGGEITRSGTAFLTELGVDLAGAQAGPPFFCRPCLDWTERRPHIGGAVVPLFATAAFDLGWVARRRNSRGLDITPPAAKACWSFRPVVLGLSASVRGDHVRNTSSIVLPSPATLIASLSCSI